MGKGIMELAATCLVMASFALPVALIVASVMKARRRKILARLDPAIRRHRAF